MFIKSMILHNYRCHKNSEIRFFNENKGGEISIIEGGDGDGKTCVFNAIGWCLYGKETIELLSEQGQTLGIPNIHEVSSDKMIDVSVELYIEFENQETGTGTPISARAIRTYKFRGDRAIGEDFSIELYYEDESPELLKDKDAQDFIDDKIPSGLVEFFMFNGEYLSSGRSVKGKNIDGSIKRQFRTGAIYSMEQLLRKVEEDYRINASKAANSQDDTILIQISDNDKEIQDTKNNKINFNNDFEKYKEKADSARKKMDELREKRAKLEGEQEMLRQLDSKRDVYKKISEDLKNKYSELYKLQYESAYLFLSSSTNKKTYEKIKEEIGHANLPPNIKKEFINDLLNMHKCICGRSLDESTHEHELVKNLIQSSEKDEKKAILLELSPQVKYIYTDKIKTYEMRLETVKKSIKELLEEQVEANDEVERMNATKSSLSSEERNVIDNFDIAEKNFNEFNKLAEDAQKNIDGANQKIERLERANQTLKDRQYRMINKVEEAKIYQKNEKLASALREIICSLRGKISSMFIDELQVKINELISTVKGLSHLSVSIKNIENSVAVEYIDENLPLGKSYLSEGQNQIVSIALIAAYTFVLKKLGGGIAHVPFVVMDHPFSDLGLPRKEEILKNFDTLFSGTKVIMLTPPGDFDLSPVKNIISSHYIVKNDPQEKVCFIKEDSL